MNQSVIKKKKKQQPAANHIPYSTEEGNETVAVEDS